jgi:hypothetical protein
MKISHGGGHACNPSYSGGRDPEDLSLRPVQVKKLARRDFNKKAG